MKTTIKVAFTLLAAMIFLSLTLPSCNQSSNLETRHVQQGAAYSEYKFRTGDTLSFPLTEHTYNRLGALSYFENAGIPYISFYDRGSKSILVFEFETGKPVSVVPLSRWVRESKLDKANVMFKNFDTIFVTTQTAFFLFDSAGKAFKQIDFFEARGKEGTVSNVEPPVIIGNYVYIGVKPNVSQKSLSAHRNWRALYKIDLKTGKKTMTYPLPPIYQAHLYGYDYLDYSYCINEKGNFVFSFAADSNVYETDLDSFEISYNAQSKFHKGPIPYMTAEQIADPLFNSYKTYAMRDSYGPITYDPVRNQYFRQAKQAASEQQVDSNFISKKKSIIILDQNFRIIGEEEYGEKFSFSSLFFTRSGKAYARVNPQNESAIQFVEVFIENEQAHIVHNK